MKDLEDSALVELARKDQAGAFDVLVDRYYKIVYSVAMKMINDSNDAADITQNVFMKVYQNFQQFNPKYKFFSWIYRIAMNEAINYCNRTDRRTEPHHESMAGEATPESLYHQSELEVNVQKALMKLKPDYRSVIVLSHFQGLSYREISETLSISEKTVKSRLFTSRQELKNILKTDGVIDA